MFLAFISIANAQWQPDVRLTNNTESSYTSYNNAWNVASNGSVVHVIFSDYRDGNSEIYYKRSTDAGVSWGTDVRLTNSPGTSALSCIAVSGLIVHTVWRDSRDGNNEIYYKSSTDAGVSWGTDMRLTNNTSVSLDPSVAVSGSVVNVVWEDQRDGNREIYYKRSTDAGVSWGADVRLTNNSSNSYTPSVAVSGSVMHVVWEDTRDGISEIYYKPSTDAGVSWGADTRLTNDTAMSEYPSVTVSGSVVHVVWDDHRDGINGEIYYKRSIDAGVSWGADMRLTNNTNLSVFSSVAVSGSVVHVVWRDERDGNYEIYYKRNPTGNSIGITNISTEIPSAFSLSQNYPNPFNPTTNIRFGVQSSGFINIKIFDILGREISTLVNEQLKPGTYEVDWDGSGFTSGVYFYTMRTGSYTETKKMLMIK